MQRPMGITTNSYSPKWLIKVVLNSCPGVWLIVHACSTAHEARASVVVWESVGAAQARYMYLMKTLGKIELAGPLGRGQVVKQVVYLWQRIAITHSMLV